MGGEGAEDEVEDLEVLEDHLVEDLEVFSVDLDHLHRDHHHQVKLRFLL